MKLIASVSRRHAKLVWELRSLKNYKKLINFHRPVNLYEYIAKSAVYYDKRWCVLADKYEVRAVVKNLIGEKYLNELYGVYDNTEDIDIDTLSTSVVVKTTNGCATNMIIEDKQSADWDQIRAKLKKWLVYPYGKITGQPHYSEMKPRIIIEKLLKQPNKSSLTDYKFFCVNGYPLFVFVYENRKLNSHKFEVGAFDMEWNPLPYFLNKNIGHASDIQKPASFDEMQSAVTKLAEGFEFVRIDFYEIEETPIFGEYTFTPSVDALSEKCRSLLFNRLTSEK